MSIKKDAEARGLNVSWLPDDPGWANQPQMISSLGGPANALPEGVHPVAANMLQGAKDTQAQTPMYMPFAPGTPTLNMRQHQEGARQFDESMAWDKQKWAEELALAKAKLSAGTSSGGVIDRATMGTLLQNFVDATVQQGGGWEHIENWIKSNAHLLPKDFGTDEATKVAYNYWNANYPAQQKSFSSAIGGVREYYTPEMAQPYEAGGKTYDPIAYGLGTTPQAIIGNTPEGRAEIGRRVAGNPWVHIGGGLYWNTQTGEMMDNKNENIVDQLAQAIGK